MAYDEELAIRIRDLLAREDRIAEKRMFGSLAFLAAGNLAVCARSDGVLVRVGPANAEEALTRPQTRPLEMGGRPMKGWVLVAAEAVEDEEALADWVGRGLAFARSLPPKESD
jgi:hypothetical protein